MARFRVNMLNSRRFLIFNQKKTKNIDVVLKVIALSNGSHAHILCNILFKKGHTGFSYKTPSG